MDKFAPELVMFWAQIQVHEKELVMIRERYDAHLNNTEEKEELKLTDEQVTQIKDLIKDKQAELKELKKIHEET